jgi:4-amino-4-deoxy-L-arabinose transferase-like glycosyltransferase
MPTNAARASLAAIGLLVALRFAAAAVLPLSADEAYYWLWSRHLSAGYFDHPPAIAWCIRLGTLLFGDTAFGVRFAPVLLSVVASAFVWRAGATQLRSEAAGLRAVLLFNLTLMVAVEALAATPDAPAIAAAAALLYALVRLDGSGDGRWWLAVGVAAGLGLLSKYTALFLGLGVLLWLVAVPNMRRWFLSPWTYAGGFVALAIFSPNLWWNATHHWETFAFQFARIETGGLTARFIFEFLAAQLALATPFVFVLGVAGLIRAGREKDLALLAALAAPATIYFFVHALHDRVQGNWPSFLFPALAVAASFASFAEWSGRAAPAIRVSRVLAMPVAAVMLLSVYAQAFFAVVPLGRADPLSRLLGVGLDDVVRRVEQDRAKSGAAALVTTDYATTGWFTFYRSGSEPVIPLNEPFRWDMAPKAPQLLLSGPLLYVVEERNDQHAFVSTLFREVERFDTIERRRGGKVVARYAVYRVSGPTAPLDARLP